MNDEPPIVEIRIYDVSIPQRSDLNATTDPGVRSKLEDALKGKIVDLERARTDHELIEYIRNNIGSAPTTVNVELEIAEYQRMLDRLKL